MVALAAMLLALSGCQSEPKKPPPAPPTKPVLFIKHHTGGTHYRTLVHNNHWYQTFGTSLLVVKPDTGAVLETIALGEFGKAGPAVDLAIVNERLLAVLEADRIIELSMAEPARPMIIGEVPSSELGLEPMAFGELDGELLVLGLDRFVRWSDRRVMAHVDGFPSSVVRAGPAPGIVATIGQSIKSIDDGSFLGAATMLAQVKHDPLNNGSVVFIRQGDGAATAGVMSRDLRELPAEPIAIRGTVHRVRQFGGRIWIVSDGEIVACRLAGDRLTDPFRLNVLGARDVDRIDDNHLAVAGSFGRSIYRIASSAAGAGDTFMATKREPSALLRCRSDPQRILAGSEQGVWTYLIGARAELSGLDLDHATATFVGASFADTKATIEPDGVTLTINTSGHITTHREPGHTPLRCVTTIEGNIWIGHGRGITVLTRQLDKSWKAEHLLRLPGEVIHFRALIAGGGAAYVSTWGGFGVAEFKHVLLTPEEIEQREKQTKAAASAR